MAKKDVEPKGPKFLDKKVSGNQCVFVFGNGQKVYFDAGKVNDDIRRQAMFHGFLQKIGDAASGFSKEKDFAGAREEMQKVIDSLYANSWNRTGGGTGVIIEDLARAISEIRKVAVEKAMAAVERATPEQRAEWAKNANVTKLMAKFKFERLSKAAETATADDLPTFEEEEEETPE